MAIFRLEAKAGKNAIGHFNYINRVGKYSNRNDLMAMEDKNLPKGFYNILNFWESAVKNERVNANIYREYVISLPKEYPNEKNKEILDKFLEKQFKDKHVYNYAIHNNDDKNPHAHVMFCERELDGIDRDSEKFFKRYNNKNPENGGSKKNRELQKKEKLIKVRKDWEEHINQYLKSSGIKEVSSKSLKNQRNEFIEKGDLINAELLNRKPFNVNMKFWKKKDNEELKKILDNNKETKELREEIENQIKQNYINLKYKKEKLESEYKSFEEILKRKEEIEINILQLTKKMEDEKIRNSTLDKLSNGEINKIKNKNRALFKKMKNANKKDKNEYKKEINQNNKKIDDIIDKYKNKVDDEILKQKAKLIKVLKYKIEDKNIIDSIFLNRLDKNNKEHLFLYKAYVERKDLREDKENAKSEIKKNKKHIKKEVDTKNYKNIDKYKKYNRTIRNNLSKIERATNNFNRSNKTQNKINKHCEFVLDEYKKIIWDIEMDINEIER